MKNARLFLAVLMVLVIPASAMAFDSMRSFTGQPESEATTYIAADTITAGMLVRHPITSAQVDDRVEGDYDTDAMVIRSQVENDTYVMGVAIWSAIPGQTVRVVTHGYANVLVIGADSTTAGAITAGALISATSTAGYAGAADATFPAHAAVDNGVQALTHVGWAEVAIPSSNTAASKRCFIRAR